MAKKEDKAIAYTFFLVGLVFLVESIVFALVLGQLPSALLGATIGIAWIYALIKFFAGLIAMYAGITSMHKK